MDTKIDNAGDIYVNVKTIIQLKCIIDGEELSWRDIKKTLNHEEIDEINIFGISNKLLAIIVGIK